MIKNKNKQADQCHAHWTSLSLVWAKLLQCNLSYNKLELEKYLILENCTVEEAQIMFKFRCRMADFQENFRGGRGPQPCQLCGIHLDNQETSFQCPEILKQLVIKHSYSEIFKKNIPVELFQTISRINSIRVEMLNKWTKEHCLKKRPTAPEELLFILFGASAYCYI